MPAFKTMNPFELSHTINTLGEGSKGFIVLLYQIYEFEKPASYRGFMGIQPGLLGLSASGLYMKTALSQTEVLCETQKGLFFNPRVKSGDSCKEMHIRGLLGLSFFY